MSEDEIEDRNEDARFGDEAQRLFAAVQDWARRTLPPPEDHSTTCQWCPLCSFVAVLRGDRPDVTERVAEAGTAVASAVRALLQPAGARDDTGEPGRRASGDGAT
jgi:hypothetical protein